MSSGLPPGPVLVTGATGMLGRVLVEGLRSLAGDRLLAPPRGELDLGDPAAVVDYWHRHRPRTVFHLAGYVRGILGNMQAGTLPLLENARIQANLLLAALEDPPDSIVVAGTVAAYAYPFVRLPLREDDFWIGQPHSAEGFYAAGKRVAIPYLEGLAQLGCGTRFAVLTNLYGPYDRFGEQGAHVVPSLVGRFVEARRSGANSVVVWGKPETTRDFLHSADAARFLVDLAVTAARDRGYAAVNVASGVETTMGELVETIDRAAGFGGPVRWDADAPIGIPRRSLDVTRLQSISDHRPLPLAEGISATVRWFEDRHR